MTEVTQRALDEGFRYFDWNVDSDDAGHAKTKDDVYNGYVFRKITEDTPMVRHSVNN